MRLFVAVNFPRELRDAVWEATEPARRAGEAARWVRPENMHLTLKFLGEVPDERDAEMRAALERAVSGARAFTVTVGGCGVFPSEQRPRVLWIGIAAEPALELLQHGVEREFAPLGFETEARPFRPHLTLGRAARDAAAGDLRRVAERLATVSYEGVARIESLDLMRSTLRPQGATYDVWQRQPLGDA